MQQRGRCGSFDREGSNPPDGIEVGAVESCPHPRNQGSDPQKLGPRSEVFDASAETIV